MSLAPAPALTVRPKAAAESSWVEHLKSLIRPDWRPGEFNHDRRLFVPDITNPRTRISVCRKAGCGVALHGGTLCPTCKISLVAALEANISDEQWMATPRVRMPVVIGCLVPDCQRSHKSQGLCSTHLYRFKQKVARQAISLSPSDWIIQDQPDGIPAAKKCIARDCGHDRAHLTGLCNRHQERLKRWAKAKKQAVSTDSVRLWLSREIEPHMDVSTMSRYSGVGATAFAELPEPLSWEYLYAVQERDRAGRAGLDALSVRGTYIALRKSGMTSVVGAHNLGRQVQDSTSRGMLVEWQRLIDDAHREWSGTDRRDPRLIYYKDLELTETKQRIGPNVRLDLRAIKNEWIIEAVMGWLRAAPRGAGALRLMAPAWTVVDEVLTARATPPHALGTADIDAMVKAVRARWETGRTFDRAIKAIATIIDFAKSDDGPHSWMVIPNRFKIDLVKHRPSEHRRGPERDSDEPFRFVPQPVVDWLMDHLHLIERSSDYLTAQARAMLFVHERCGRRTGETTNLRDDCISYDNQGAPYLEWQSGKPPYHEGKRLPIHQETHDVIREWQRIKRENGINSAWLFPSNAYSAADRPYDTKYIGVRLRELLRLVAEHAPFHGPVEGAEGNLVYFDLATVDPYSFRHAFAQRLADATDAEGRSTTSPDVLQDYMGHQSFNTTMGYYQVTAKRRKKALAAIPPRRLNLLGQVIPVDRERDGFGRIAVTSGHCSEPQNVAANGHSCALDHACESCPFFLVDPLERDGIGAKRQHLRVNLERAAIIESPQHILDHYQARIEDCTTIIDGIDTYIDNLSMRERNAMRHALESMAEIRRRATAPRTIDLRDLLRRGQTT